MENEKKAPIFSEGLTFRMPSDKAPDFILLQMAVQGNKFFKWCQDHQDERGWVNLTIKRSKNNTVYADLDTWKPKQEEAPQRELTEQDKINIKSAESVGQTLTDEELDSLANIPF